MRHEKSQDFPYFVFLMLLFEEKKFGYYDILDVITVTVIVLVCVQNLKYQPECVHQKRYFKEFKLSSVINASC